MRKRVILRTNDGKVCEIATGVKLQEAAMRWNYIVGHRNRWLNRPQAHTEVMQRASDTLAALGVKKTHLKKLAQGQIVEVSVPFRREEEGWEARIFPWEFALTAATKEYRGENSFLVVRHLDRGGRPRKTQAPRTLAILETAPGPLRDKYDFEAEKALVRASLHRLKPLPTMQHPTRDQLGERLKEVHPDVLHVTGIDTRLGAEILGNPTRGVEDGLLLAGTTSPIDAVNAKDLAALLTSGRPKPLLVGFNCWNSGSRLASLVVAEGAEAALGFEHTFDDSIAELFFTNYYRAWSENTWNYVEAFLHAWLAIRSYHERIRGSSLVLWTSRSIGDPKAPQFSSASLADIRRSARKGPLKPQRGEVEADPGQHKIHELISLEVRPFPQLNYALLHNRQCPLERFVLRFTPPDGTQERQAVTVIRNIEIEILLHVGADSFPYRAKLDLHQDHPIIDLADPRRERLPNTPADSIRIPLTSGLARSVDECMLTSLFTQVRWHDQLLHRDTHAVSLMPVDEWRLADKEIQWLPSFVQPRDPAVADVIRSAQRYLMCLADYPGAGFDGYQSFNPDGESVEAQWEGVDLQVRAIWSALLFDRTLHYINPPPSYSDSSQRLRTPRQTIQQCRGTCVDLALLVASCLEWIEVYPVIFMLHDHAFPGYWRSLDAHSRFTEVDKTGPIVRDEASTRDTPSTPATSLPWVSNRSAYGELREYVLMGELVPLESVFLTAAKGFEESVDEGRSYFQLPRSGSFHSMIDIVNARGQVTPLPLDLRE